MPRSAPTIAGSSPCGGTDGRSFWSDAGEQVAVLDHGKGKIYEARLSRDGTQLLTVGSGLVRLWDARTWQVIRSFEGEPSSHTLSLPDSRHAALAHDDGAVDLIRLDRAAKVVRQSGHRARVRVVTLSADGSRALTGDEEGAVRMWDTATGSPLAALHDHEGPVSAVRFSANGRLFVTGGEDGTVRAYYTRVGDLIDLARSRAPVSR